MPPAWPRAVAERARGDMAVTLRQRQHEPGMDWPGVVPSAARWCAGCRLNRKRTAAKYQAEIPQAVELCGRGLERLWREARDEIVVARRLPVLSQRAAQPGQDALLRRLAAAGLRVPGLAGRFRP